MQKFEENALRHFTTKLGGPPRPQLLMDVVKRAKQQRLAAVEALKGKDPEPGFETPKNGLMTQGPGLVNHSAIVNLKDVE